MRGQSNRPLFNFFKRGQSNRGLSSRGGAIYQILRYMPPSYIAPPPKIGNNKSYSPRGLYPRVYSSVVHSSYMVQGVFFEMPNAFFK